MEKGLCARDRLEEWHNQKQTISTKKCTLLQFSLIIWRCNFCVGNVLFLPFRFCAVCCKRWFGCCLLSLYYRSIMKVHILLYYFSFPSFRYLLLFGLFLWLLLHVVFFKAISVFFWGFFFWCGSAKGRWKRKMSFSPFNCALLYNIDRLIVHFPTKLTVF